MGGFTFMAPYNTARRLAEAVEGNRADELAELVDFPSLRNSFKVQVDDYLSNEVADSGPLARVGAWAAGKAADSLVDSLVTPAGVRRLIAARTLFGPEDAHGSAAFADAEMGYDSLSAFHIVLPSGSGGLVLRLRRVGLGWKLSSVELGRNR